VQATGNSLRSFFAPAITSARRVAFGILLSGVIARPTRYREQKGTNMAVSAASGLITKPSKYSVQETIERFEAAVKAQGWVVFTELDHTVAAAQAGLALHPRTVIVFGYPKVGTLLMQQAPTLAIDVPLKALVWQDEQGQVWLTYNASEYMRSVIYPRHGLTVSADALKNMEQVLNEASDHSTR
jgi:uncharacterized protein (DUF302 family)